MLYFFSFPVSLPHFLGASDHLLNNLHLNPCRVICLWCLWGSLARTEAQAVGGTQVGRAGWGEGLESLPLVTVLPQDLLPVGS